MPPPAVSQVWGYDCPGCRENDWGYDSEAEAERALDAHMERSPECKEDDDADRP